MQSLTVSVAFYAGDAVCPLQSARAAGAESAGEAVTAQPIPG